MLELIGNTNLNSNEERQLKNYLASLAVNFGGGSGDDSKPPPPPPPKPKGD